MELKRVSTAAVYSISELLIVPYGIETGQTALPTVQPTIF